MTTTQARPAFILIRHHNSYEFHPETGGDETTIRFVHGRRVEVYSVPTEEARQLWARLTRSGYEKF